MGNGLKKISKLGELKMIKVKNLTKVYRTHEKQTNIVKDFFARKYKESLALNNISFEIDESELIGFIGPNGAGKTTTMKILSGILYPTQGEISVLGYWPFQKQIDFLKQIAFIMGQKNQLLWDLPATETFKLNKEIYELKESEYKKHLHELMELLVVQDFINKPVRNLSLGQRMRVELIAALLHKPKVLFLDEPTIGLDIFAQTTIINFIREYQTKYNATIILTSHYMKDIQRLAKRVILIDQGKLIYDGQLSKLVDNYSKEKSLQIVLKKPIDKKTLARTSFKYEYNFPILKVKLTKHKLLPFMQEYLSKIEYSDFTLEDEAIEEVIKKVFKKP